MARLMGIDLPRNKRVEIALTYIFGIGRPRARSICKEVGISDTLRTDALTDEQIAGMRALIEGSFKVEGDLRREISMAIKRLTDVNCYRGTRHRKGLPVRGQNTRSNARTRKGPKKTVANKKKVV
ncbi:MAG: 30S ribosomal protein S13 [Bdellovibrionales bacterium RIFCSPHIGHO2_01_FULL_40_29]|nr:MAG: 30S ribosomal protein S13 [Bdellovibrionales bacterium RIFCSPHIGHO2_01_FULL_40_29]OFZ33898.1 MAG: 30S ribosomal protein S13 [Bdellovibrionales bacterium RIFCSPHIGHO2_02_FULL_40_15]